eukprot:scpid86284/ scgid28798/ 
MERGSEFVDSCQSSSSASSDASDLLADPLEKGAASSIPMEETCNVEPFGASVGSAAAAKSSDRHPTPPSTDFGGVSVASKAASESIDVAASTSDSCGLSVGCEIMSKSSTVPASSTSSASSADSGRASADSASWDENSMEVMEVAANPDESVINCLKARVEAIQKGGKLGELSAFSAVSGADSAKASADHHYESNVHVQGSIDFTLQVATPNLTGFRPIEGEPEPCPASPDSAEVAKYNARFTYDGLW